MVNFSVVGCGQRIVLGCRPSDPRYFTHVGRVGVIEPDGHARLSHHRTTRHGYLSGDADLKQAIKLMRDRC
jgi:hypothetical protein